MEEGMDELKFCSVHRDFKVSPECVEITTDFSMRRNSYPAKLTGKMRLRIDCSGALDIALCDVRSSFASYLPRFGIVLVMNEAYRKAEYFGYGPYESYVDKHCASRLGFFGTDASMNFEHYVRPQENGSHYDTRYAEVTDKYDTGVEIIPAGDVSSFSFGILPYSAETLTNAHNDRDLPESKNTYVYIDYKQNGIGSNSCGPALSEKYAFSEKEFSFSVRIMPKA